MPLTNRELFKRAFIKQCADEGLTEEGQVLDRISSFTKQANPLANFVNWFDDAFQKAHNPPPGVEAGPSPVPAALAGAVIAPAAIGAGAGALASKLKGNWLDEEDVKQQELTDELRRQTELARQFRRMGGSSPQSF